MSEIPENWVRTTLGEVTEIISGATPSSKNPEYFTSDKNGIPWITPSDLSNYKEIFITRGNRDLTQKGLAACSARLIPKGSVLFSSRAPIGYVAIADSDFATNQGFKSFMLPREIYNKFLYFYLRSIKSLAESLATGTTFKELSSKATANLPIVLPPLLEQKRIADKLEQLLGRVDSSKAKLQQAQTTVKRLRQAVLTAAASGELTKDWREEKGILIEWEIDTIGNLIVDKPRNGYSPKSVEYATKTKSLTLTATTSGYFNSKYHKYIDEKIPLGSYLWLEPNDILIQRSNALEYVGISAIYDGKPKEFIYPDIMIKIRANNRIKTKFLYYLLHSNTVRAYFRKNATGTAGNMPKINQQTIINAPAVVPSLPEQLEIVARVEKLLAFASSLEQRIEQALLSLERLTPSILAKAFRGELVPQDPTDEPASVLLERIKAARVAEEAVPKQRKPRTIKVKSVKAGGDTMKRLEDLSNNYLSNTIRIQNPNGLALEAKALWQVSELKIDDFYQQLSNEISAGFVRISSDNPTLVEAA